MHNTFEPIEVLKNWHVTWFYEHSSLQLPHNTIGQFGRIFLESWFTSFQKNVALYYYMRFLYKDGQTQCQMIKHVWWLNDMLVNIN